MGGGYFTKNKISFYFNLNDVSKVVDILDDEYSKNLYLSAICNYVSKTQGFLISLYYGNIWKYYYLLAKAKTSHKITINYFDYFLYDLSLINLAPLKLYYSQLGIFADFYLEQYSYKHIIKANAGDFVIDGGACYGDTALYFSNLVGESGKVFAFEFVSENIEIFNKNLSLNPHISNIKLIKSPLYKDSDTFVSSDGVGGSARLDHSSCNIKTISIDDFIQKEGVVKIDFIKLDIEGSELDALKGAINCIKKFKPKLAICLYHSAKDYSEIPLFLHSIMPEYKFYFDHFTLGRYESVLFAI